MNRAVPVRRSTLRTKTCMLLAGSVFFAGCADKVPMATKSPDDTPKTSQTAPQTGALLDPAAARAEVERRRVEVAKLTPQDRVIKDLRPHPAAQKKTVEEIKTQWVGATGKSWDEMKQAVEALKASGSKTVSAVVSPDPKPLLDALDAHDNGADAKEKEKNQKARAAVDRFGRALTAIRKTHVELAEMVQPTAQKASAAIATIETIGTNKPAPNSPDEEKLLGPTGTGVALARELQAVQAKPDFVEAMTRAKAEEGELAAARQDVDVTFRDLSAGKEQAAAYSEQAKQAQGKSTGESILICLSLAGATYCLGTITVNPYVLLVVFIVAAVVMLFLLIKALFFNSGEGSGTGGGKPGTAAAPPAATEPPLPAGATAGQLQGSAGTNQFRTYVKADTFYFDLYFNGDRAKPVTVSVPLGDPAFSWLKTPPSGLKVESVVGTASGDGFGLPVKVTFSGAAAELTVVEWAQADKPVKK